MKKLLEFIKTFNLYRKEHHTRYAAKVAWQIAFKGAPF